MAGEKGDTDELLDIFDIEDPQLPDEVEDNAFSSGDYPYEEKLKRRIYEEELETLQVELVKLKRHMMEVGKRAIIVFEGRDAAGKGGTINAFKQYMNPRSCRVVALPKPTDKERGQWYFQRYAKHFPTAGEVVLYDRSWYNRAGVEPVMGFCSDDQYEAFLDEVPRFENMLVREGIHFFKFWLDVGREMQMKRFHDRRHSPLKIWKLSPMDLKALTKWGDYTDARDRMLAETHSDKAPWVVVRSNDKRRARLNAIRHFLKSMEYEGKDAKAIGEIDDKILGIGPKFLK